jgi:hypothetical protein
MRIAGSPARMHMKELSRDLLALVLHESGSSWTIAVCRLWRDVVCERETVRRALMVQKCGRGDYDLAVRIACACGYVEVVRTLFGTAGEGGSGDDHLVTAARHGQEHIVRLLLEWPVMPPRADCLEGEALVQAAAGGDEGVVRLLLGWPTHAPRADCQSGMALVAAAGWGRMGVVLTLMKWPRHAPRADCLHGEALVDAASGGFETIVRLLLEWPRHAPRADCQQGEAMAEAARFGHDAVVRLLQSKAPRQTRHHLRPRGYYAV